MRSSALSNVTAANLVPHFLGRAVLARIALVLRFSFVCFLVPIPGLFCFRPFCLLALFFLFRELSLLRFFVFKKPARSLDVAWLSQNSDKVCGRSLTRLDSSRTTTFPKFKIWMMRVLVCTLVAIRNVR